jgi:hypothetical protein
MIPAPKISRWQEGRVDLAKQHFELRYGPAEDGWTEDGWIPVALIGPPKNRIVNVQFLVDPSDPNNAETVNDVKREIQFYLIDKGETDPWGYAKYHCGTESNIYSPVHWSIFKSETKNKAQDSLSPR